MGFFGAVSKILQGKPVYDSNGEANPLPPGNPESIPALGAKSIPVVQLRRVECHCDDMRMEVFADIHNDSTDQVLLDKILLLGTKQELDVTLRPGEARQFKVYSGSCLDKPAGGYAEVQYRKTDGDYFASLHQIRSRQERNGSWSVTEFIPQLPIRDLH